MLSDGYSHVPGLSGSGQSCGSTLWDPLRLLGVIATPEERIIDHHVNDDRRGALNRWNETGARSLFGHARLLAYGCILLHQTERCVSLPAADTRAHSRADPRTSFMVRARTRIFAFTCERSKDSGRFCRLWPPL